MTEPPSENDSNSPTIPLEGATKAGWLGAGTAERRQPAFGTGWGENMKFKQVTP